MKKLILATAVTAAVVVYFVGDKDQPVEDNTVMQNPAEQTDSMVESTNVSGAQVAVSDKSAVSESAMPSSSSDGQDYSAYNQDNNSLENERVSNSSYSRYSGETESYNDDYNSSSSSDSSSEDYRSSDNSSSYGTESTDGSDRDSNDDNADSKDTEKEELPTEKFQRIYDNGITWYGDYGTLNVQYQSSNAETTGIGFRLHYNSSSIKVTSINQYTDGALVMTSPESSQNDTNRNYDNNDSTDAYLTFAWFEMNSQWPMATQVNLATIEFERLNNGTNDYSIDYSVTSNSAGYQFVK
ncbi:hypothetical protein N9I42_01080 [Porticoccaceae bacterium]|nr:hypothetical protein [Porticoccaceae bacterium]